MTLLSLTFASSITAKMVKAFDPAPDSSVGSSVGASLLARIAHEPCFDHLLLKTPLIAHLECRKFPLRHQTVHGELVYLEVVGYLLGS